MEDYGKQFRTMVKKLVKNPQIDVINFQVNDPIDEAICTEIKKKYNIRLPEVLQNFYKQTNGITLKWVLKPIQGGIDLDEDEEVHGSIRLLPIENVFGGWNGKGWQDDLWFDWMNKKQIANIQKLKPFDYFDSDDSGCVCFRAKNRILESTMYLHSVNYGINKLAIRFEKYLKMLLETRGFFRWQYVITSNEDMDCKEFNHIYELFPDTDFSKYES